MTPRTKRGAAEHEGPAPSQTSAAPLSASYSVTDLSFVLLQIQNLTKDVAKQEGKLEHITADVGTLKKGLKRLEIIIATAAGAIVIILGVIAFLFNHYGQILSFLAAPHH